MTLTVIGAGLAGLSASYHHGHDDTVVLEQHDEYGGHVRVREHDGCLWDEGPHISFTKDEYVRELFADAVDGEFVEFDTVVRNVYHGATIDHPAHVALHQVPEPLRSECLRSFLDSREWAAAQPPPTDYREWLVQQFGPVYATTFPTAYTRKYWTLEPEQLDPSFIGSRLGFPDVDEVVAGARGDLGENKHYITTARYPTRGGYVAYARTLAEGANIRYGSRVERVDFAGRTIGFADGTEHAYTDLVSTMPLPKLIEAGTDVPDDVREAAARLRCTDLYLIEVVADHPLRRDEHWLYVYDLDKYTTRVSFMNRWSPHNAPEGVSAIQVEYYGSDVRPLPKDTDAMADKVVDELVEIGCVDHRDAVTGVHVEYIPWANVVFDLDRAASLEVVNGWLDEQGVRRAGRFGKWEYMWTDGAVLTGREAVADL